MDSIEFLLSSGRAERRVGHSSGRCYLRMPMLVELSCKALRAFKDLQSCEFKVYRQEGLWLRACGLKVQ